MAKSLYELGLYILLFYAMQRHQDLLLPPLENRANLAVAWAPREHLWNPC
jgi:hypothetical protein